MPQERAGQHDGTPTGRSARFYIRAPWAGCLVHAHVIVEKDRVRSHDVTVTTIIRSPALNCGCHAQPCGDADRACAQVSFTALMALAALLAG
jgi:hypothetical protein